MSGELGSALSDEWGICPSRYLSMMGFTFLYTKGKLEQIVLKSIQKIHLYQKKYHVLLWYTTMKFTKYKANSITVMELINSITVMELNYTMSIPSR